MCRIECTPDWIVTLEDGGRGVRLERRADQQALRLEGDAAMEFLEQHGEMEAAHRQPGTVFHSWTWDDCLHRLCREWMPREAEP